MSRWHCAQRGWRTHKLQGLGAGYRLTCMTDTAIEHMVTAVKKPVDKAVQIDTRDYVGITHRNASLPLSASEEGIYRLGGSRTSVQWRATKSTSACAGRSEPGNVSDTTAQTVLGLELFRDKHVCSSCSRPPVDKNNGVDFEPWTLPRWRKRAGTTRQ